MRVIKVHPDATLQFLALLYFDRYPVNIALLLLDKAINLCEEIEIRNGSSYQLYHILTNLTPTSKLKRLTFFLVESNDDDQLKNMTGTVHSNAALESIHISKGKYYTRPRYRNPPRIEVVQYILEISGKLCKKIHIGNELASMLDNKNSSILI